jgi:hypothetical protein
MHGFFSLLRLIALIWLLSGCQTANKKEYIYLPPDSVADKQCIARCSSAKKHCYRICELKNSRSCNCIVSFNTCYSACGGQVVTKS